LLDASISPNGGSKSMNRSVPECRMRRMEINFGAKNLTR
jgi:hypothetical protein